VFQNEEQKEESLAISASVAFSGFSVSAKASASFGSSSASATSESIAERSISVDLYSLQADALSVDDLSPEFLAHIKSLPDRFSLAPHSYLSFLRHWGRYVVKGGVFGGSLTMDMRFKTSSSATAQDISVGVEAAYDGICSAAGSLAMDMSSKTKSLMGDSKISIHTSGGDPQVAATITDLLPGTDKSASFRGDIQAWLRSIARYPRLNSEVPTLIPVYDILPTDEKEGEVKWSLKKTALRYAHNVFASDPQGAKHFDSRVCTETKTGEPVKWNDFDRITTDQCIAFSAQVVSNISLYLSGAPGISSLTFNLNIGSTGVALIMGGDVVAYSVIPLGVAPGMPGLVGDFWVCLSKNSDSDKDETYLRYGRGDQQVLQYKLKIPIPPKYFAFGCNKPAWLVSVGVHPYESWSKFIQMKKVCYIQDCKEYASLTKCTCKTCGPRRVLSDRSTSCEIDPKCCSPSFTLTLKINEKSSFFSKQSKKPSSAEKRRLSSKLRRMLSESRTYPNSVSLVCPHSHSTAMFSIKSKAKPFDASCCGSRTEGDGWNDAESISESDEYVRVTKITAKCLPYLMSVSFTYLSSKGNIVTKPHGGGGHKASYTQELNIRDDDYLTEVTIYSDGKRVTAAIFVTNQMHFLSCGIGSGTPSTFKAGSTEQILFIAGRSSDEVKQLRVMRAPRATNGQVEGVKV
jgi:hypothetical protein